MNDAFSFFRPMTEADLDWVMATELLAYDFPWSRSGFEKALDDGLSYVFCNSQQRLLGYAFFLTVLDEVHLLNFCVHPRFHRQGIGRCALASLMQHFTLTDYTRMLLEVRESNPAIALYQALGFQCDGVRRDYYRAQAFENGDWVEAREDAILMSCALDG